MGTGRHLARWGALVNKSDDIYSTDVTGVVMDSSDETYIICSCMLVLRSLHYIAVYRGRQRPTIFRALMERWQI